MNLSSVSLMLQDKYNFQYRLDMHVPVLAVRCKGSHKGPIIIYTRSMFQNLQIKIQYGNVFHAMWSFIQLI